VVLASGVFQVVSSAVEKRFTQTFFWLSGSRLQGAIRVHPSTVEPNPATPPSLYTSINDLKTKTLIGRFTGPKKNTS
jgi:hypothetical protein